MNKLFDLSKANSGSMVENVLNDVIKTGRSNIKLNFSNLGIEPEPYEHCYNGPVVHFGMVEDKIKILYHDAQNPGVSSTSWMTNYGYTIDAKRKLVYPWYNKPEDLLTIWYDYEDFEDNGFDILLAYEYSSSEDLLRIVKALRKNMPLIDYKLRDTDDINRYELKNMLME